MSKFLRIFLLNPNFLLLHRNRYSEGMDNGQKNPRGHPNFNSYVKNLPILVFQTDRQTDRQMDRDINLVWASLTTFLHSHLLRVGWRTLSKTAEKEFLQPTRSKCTRPWTCGVPLCQFFGCGGK